MTFLEIVEDHGWDAATLEEQWDTAIDSYLCDTGFVMITYRHQEDVFVMTAAAVNDEYTRGMWRFIRTLLKDRKCPIVTQYERNYDKLMKASQRYGAIALENNIVIFP